MFIMITSTGNINIIMPILGKAVYKSLFKHTDKYINISYFLRNPGIPKTMLE